jgi:uncharacterized pyridoxamine 5'-phosphate oxidase family protein
VSVCFISKTIQQSLMEFSISALKLNVFEFGFGLYHSSLYMVTNKTLSVFSKMTHHTNILFVTWNTDGM